MENIKSIEAKDHCIKSKEGVWEVSSIMIVTPDMREIGNYAKQRRFRGFIQADGFDVCFFLQENKRSVIS